MIAVKVTETVYKCTHIEVYVIAGSGVEFMARLHIQRSGASRDIAKDDMVYLRFEAGDMLTFQTHNKPPTEDG